MTTVCKCSVAYEDFYKLYPNGTAEDFEHYLKGDARFQEAAKYNIKTFQDKLNNLVGKYIKYARHDNVCTIMKVNGFKLYDNETAGELIGKMYIIDLSCENLPKITSFETFYITLEDFDFKFISEIPSELYNKTKDFVDKFYSDALEIYHDSCKS